MLLSLATLKSYFKYQVSMVGCGIPFIELDGTVEDWESILNKTESLRKYELSWWINQIVPILSKIIETKKEILILTFGKI